VFLQRTLLPLPVLFLFSIIQTFLLPVLLFVQCQTKIRVWLFVSKPVCCATLVLSDVYAMIFNTFTNVFFFTLNISSKSLILFSPVFITVSFTWAVKTLLFLHFLFYKLIYSQTADRRCSFPVMSDGDRPPRQKEQCVARC
jgi:hypothetical protein